MIIGEVGKERQESCGFLLQLDQSNLMQQSMKQLHQSSVILLDPMHLKVKQTKGRNVCYHRKTQSVISAIREKVPNLLPHDHCALQLLQ